MIKYSDCLKKNIIVGTFAIFWLVLMQVGELLPLGAVPVFAILATIPVIFIAVFFPSSVRVGYRLSVISIFGLGIVAIQSVLPVISGPDSQVYFYNFSHFSLDEMVTHIVDSWRWTLSGITEPTFTFPLLAKIWLGGLASLGPRSIAFFNAAIWLFSSLLWVGGLRKMLSGYLSVPASTSTLVFVLLMLLPSSLYWSSMMAKDVAVTSVTIFGALAIVDKRYVLSVLLLLLALLFRPYAPLLALLFGLFLSGRTKTLLLGVIVSFAFLFIVSKGSIAILINVPILAGYLFLSPNPFDPNNWFFWLDTGTWVLSPALLAVEGVITSILCIVGLCIALRKKRVRPMLFRLGLAILIGSAVLVLVGFLRQESLGASYGVGTLGENIVRKKFALWPLIVIWGAVSILEFWQSAFGSKKIWYSSLSTRFSLNK